MKIRILYLSFSVLFGAFLLLSNSGGRATVAGFAAAAGKAHLAGVVAQVVGAAREQHGQALLARHQRHQNGGFGGLAAPEQAAVAGMFGLEGQPGGKALAQGLGLQPLGRQRRQM